MLGAGRTDGTGEPNPRRNTRQPGRKSRAGKALPSPSFLRAWGGLLPHTPTLGRQQRVCEMGISANTQQTTPSTPRPPSAGGRTHRRLISPSKAPLESGHSHSRPRSRPDGHPPGGRGWADLHMQMRHGGGGEGHAWSPPSVPPAGAQIPPPPVTELVPLCRLSRNQSRHGCDT